MNFQAAPAPDRLLQGDGQGRAGGNGQPRAGRNDPRLLPGVPQRRHSRERNRGLVLSRAAQDFRQRRGRQDQRDSLQQQRQHQVGKSVRMRQRNDPEIGPVRPQAHGRDEVGGVGRQLFGPKGHQPDLPVLAEVIFKCTHPAGGGATSGGVCPGSSGHSTRPLRHAASTCRINSAEWPCGCTIPPDSSAYASPAAANCRNVHCFPMATSRSANSSARSRATCRHRS